jgi:AcrR family transcriptional regulator
VAARDVFEARGYQATTVGAITARANTAHGTFYLYFKNKDDAFGQVLNSIQEQITDESRAALSEDRFDSLAGAIRGFLVVFVQYRGLMRAFLEGMMLSPEIEASWRAMRADFTTRIAHRLEREHAAGVVRSLDPLAAAQALSSMSEWYAFTHLVLGDPTSPTTENDLDEAVATLADLWYHAVYGTTDRSR